jgi:LAO/AO transport system kinase
VAGSLVDSRAEELVAAAQRGDPRSLARLVSLVENGSEQLRAVMRAVAPHTGNARVIGLTGSPGVGKSTVTGQLIRAYRAAGQRVGVLAVDPTSPFSGGALLGDRVRMADHATDSGVFIRSMASRGHLGGLSWSAPQALRILDAAGFDVICVETVGVGQAEVEIAGLADTTVVVMAPGLGDSIQTAKAGILEVADIFVVNKSDRPGASEVARDLRAMLAMSGTGPGGGSGAGPGWRPPIVLTAAAAAASGSGSDSVRGSASGSVSGAVSGTGIEDLVARLEEHWSWLAESGRRSERRVARAREEISAIAVADIRRRLGGLPGESRLDDLAEKVADGKLDPYTAADDLLAG